MNFTNILNDIENADLESNSSATGRRQVLKSFGSKVALAALPLAVGSLFFNKAYGKTTDTVISILNYALELQFFQYNFYHSALATGNNTTSTLIPAADRPGFLMVESQELAQLTFLRNTIIGMGGVPFTPNNYPADPATGNPYTPGSYDFTGGNKFQVYISYDAFLQVAQAFEDMVVRANLAVLPSLVANTSDIMTQFMQMNAVQARHSSFVRLVRRFYPDVDYPKPWVTNNMPPAVALQSFYLGEDNTVQRGIDITSLPGITGTLSQTAATEAFDEPMDMTTVRTLIAPFLI